MCFCYSKKTTFKNHTDLPIPSTFIHVCVKNVFCWQYLSIFFVVVKKKKDYTKQKHNNTMWYESSFIHLWHSKDKHLSNVLLPYISECQWSRHWRSFLWESPNWGIEQSRSCGRTRPCVWTPHTLRDCLFVKIRNFELNPEENTESMSMDSLRLLPFFPCFLWLPVALALGKVHLRFVAKYLYTCIVLFYTCFLILKLGLLGFSKVFPGWVNNKDQLQSAVRFC